MSSCPCGSKQPLAECCGPYVEGKAAAPTAEALMRSRYTAYVQQKVKYVLDTHDPETMDGLDAKDVEQWSRQAEWLGLDVVDTKDGGADDDSGEVEFVARYRMRGQDQVHRERATFRKHEGKWLFRDGVPVKGKSVVREGPKVGRNDPCPCGSGKKHKKCCGRAGAQA